VAENSAWWTTNGVGDGPALVTGYSQSRLVDVYRTLATIDPTTQAVAEGRLNEFAAAGTATPVVVQSGEAWIDGRHYFSDAPINVAISTPVATRIDRIVLRRDATAQTIRLVALVGTAGGSMATLTQNSTTYEVELWRVSVTSGGVITLTDLRVFLATPGVRGAMDNITLRWNTSSKKAEVKDAGLTGAKLAAAIDYSGVLTVNNTAPEILYNESDQTADNQLWGAGVNGKVWFLRVINDAKSSALNAVTVTRGTGVAVSAIGLIANTSVTGTLAVSGTLSAAASTLASLTVSGAAVVGGTLNVSGTASVVALNASASVSVGTTLGVVGTATMFGNAVVGGTLGVTGLTTVSALNASASLSAGTTLTSAGLATLASLAVTAGATVGGSLVVSGGATAQSFTSTDAAGPEHFWNVSGQTANNRLWDIGGSGATLFIRALNDGLSSAAAALIITRGAAVGGNPSIASVAIGANTTITGTLNVTGTFSPVNLAVSGAATVVGLLSATGGLAVTGGVTNATLAPMASATVKGQVVSGSGVPVDLTAAQLATILVAGSGSTSLLSLTGRQGGDVAQWGTAGATDYTPVGPKFFAGTAVTSAAGVVTVTFPSAFVGTPVVTAAAFSSNPITVTITALTATTVSFKTQQAGFSVTATNFCWMAVGQG